MLYQVTTSNRTGNFTCDTFFTEGGSKDYYASECKRFRTCQPLYTTFVRLLDEDGNVIEETFFEGKQIRISLSKEEWKTIKKALFAWAMEKEREAEKLSGSRKDEMLEKEDEIVNLGEYIGDLIRKDIPQAYIK